MRIGLSSSALAALLLASAPAAFAQAPEAARRYEIAPGPLEQALPAFARQSGQQILYPAALVAGRRSPGLSGTYTAEAALAAVLRDTGLAWRRSRPNVFVVYNPAARAETAPEAEPITLEEVVVTGSLIRGVADGPSPVVVVSREDIDRGGYATVAQALAALPQNFGGTANEGALQNGADRSGANGTFASGVNLRGLGSDATLVLVNGRRMAGVGAMGDFADISTLPTSAIKRIDVLLDGASALYGADAVGGVVNIILRDDYDGAETRLRVGGTADGASDEYQFGQTLGMRWSSGSLLGVYEFYERGALPVSERRLAGDADLRWRGGSDRRLNYASPGNIVVFDPVSGGYVSAWAIPAGQDGTDLEPGDFLVGQTNLSNQRLGMNVLPEQTRHSLFAALRQDLGPRAVLSADARYGLRRYETVSAPFATLLTVNTGNPWFVSPTGASSHTIAYSFEDDLPNPVITGEAESLGASVGVKVDLFDHWRLDAYAAYASETGENRTRGTLNSTFLREALGAVADNPATPFSAERDGYFNPFGDGGDGPAAVLAFIGSGRTATLSESAVSSANLQVDGTVLSLPGGPLRLATGLSYREETFWRRNDSFTSGVTPVTGVPTDSSRRVSAVFGELRMPLFGPDNARPGFERLELSLAARFERYEDIGETTSPKIGVVWAPSEDLTLRANYGASYRAPALRELNDAARASPTFLPRGSQQILSMILYGGNPDLESEQADTWTLGADYRPAGLDGLRLTANWFRTDFDNRIGQPTFENILIALTDPALSPFVRLVDPLNNAEDRAAVQAILDLPTTAFADAYPATSYGAIVDARYVNTARVEVEGVDVSGGYAFEVGPDAFDLSLAFSYLDRFDSQATPRSATVSLKDRPNYPVGLRGRGALAWSHGDWGLSSSINYVAGYEDLAGDRIDPWTTLDLQLRYEPQSGPLRGTTVALNIQNVLDRDPPFYNAPEGIGYDAANTNVLGRFLSLQLTRSW
jgi:outer membrane receptor protein involved in Fe transport